MSSGQPGVRLVHLADYGGSYAGSFVTMIAAMLSLARERGWAAEAVFSPVARERPWVADLESRGLAVRFMPARPPAKARESIGQLLAEDRRPTILHTHFTAFDIPAVKEAARVEDAVVIWHNHMGPTRRPATVARNVAKYLAFARRVDRMLCVAPDAAAAARHRGAPSSRLLFFPNGIDTSRFPLRSAERRAAARAELDVPDGTHLLLHFGWDWIRKGGDILLASARELVDAGVPIRVVTVGAPQEAREMADQLGLGEGVQLLPPREDVLGLFAAADVFMACSRSEANPFAVVESLCSGCPVVASRIPAHEWIAPGLAARRLTGLDPAEMTSAVRGLLERDGQVAAAETEQARDWVLENMELGAWAERLMAVYEAALPGHSPVRS